MSTLWLRTETYGKPTADTRCPITPEQAKILVDSGHELFIEKSPHRVFADEEYAKAGCRLVEPGSWYDAPRDAFILGLKYLPIEERFNRRFSLPQKLIFFAHGWNADDSGSRIISRLEEGRDLYSHQPTPFYDLEDLVDDNGKRVAAFGYYAGYAGTLLALQVWCQKELGKEPPYKAPDATMGREAMVAQLHDLLEEVAHKTGRKPTSLVIAPNGRCGRGAVGLLNELGLTYTPWTREQTGKGHPFPEILDHDVLLNCVSFSHDNPKFIQPEDLKQSSRLSVIGDISCYPGPFNPIDIYDDITSYDHLTHTVPKRNGTIDVVAIENLPRLLARDASMEYSGVLFPHLKALLDDADKGQTPAVWQRADNKSHRILSAAGEIKTLGMSISYRCFAPDNGRFDTEKADAMLTQWLERHPLSMSDTAGFSRFLADGAGQTYCLRIVASGTQKQPEPGTPEYQQQYRQLETLEQWAQNLNIKARCNTPHIRAHHAIETEADRFLRSAAGRTVMQDEALRQRYLRVLDAAHLLLNGQETCKARIDKAIAHAGEIAGDSHQSREITAGFEAIRTLATHALSPVI